jgi:hemerythrin
VVVAIDRVLHEQHQQMRRLLVEVRSARAAELEPVFEALTDAVEVDWILSSRHLHPLLQKSGYPDLYRTIEVHRALCHIVDDLRNLCEWGPQFSSALNVLSARLEQHIVDTERMVMPFLARRLSPEQQELVGVEMLETLAELDGEDWLGGTPAWRSRVA